MREFKDLKIAVAGTGYVGLSIATLLSQHHKVTAVDIIPEKVELINNKKSPIQDEYIEKYLAEKELDLTATLDAKEAYSDADFVVIAAPTNSARSGKGRGNGGQAERTESGRGGSQRGQCRHLAGSAGCLAGTTTGGSLLHRTEGRDSRSALPQSGGGKSRCGGPAGR